MEDTLGKKQEEMLQSEAIQKLAIECHTLAEQYPEDQFSIIKKYIQMALCVGLDHFSDKMEEIVVLDYDGVERGIYKSTQDASAKLGVHRKNITATLNGLRPTAGGYKFIRRKDYILLRRPSKKPCP